MYEILQRNMHQNPACDIARVTSKRHQIILHGNKIYFPKSIITPVYSPILQWYHENLQHPGADRLFGTLNQHFLAEYITGWQDAILLYKTCPACQLLKRPTKKYGYLPVKDSEATPWHTMCVDLIGPYEVTLKNKEKIKLLAVSMIDPATNFSNFTAYLIKKVLRLHAR